jgi:hypothetical protein
MSVNSVTYVCEQQQKVLPICMNSVTHVYESSFTYVSDCTSGGKASARAARGLRAQSKIAPQES